MSLIRLLSVGRSLMNVPGGASRYTVVGPNFFPKLQPVIRSARADTNAKWLATSRDPNSTDQPLKLFVKEFPEKAWSSPVAVAPQEASGSPAVARSIPTGQRVTTRSTSATKLWWKLLQPFSSWWWPGRNQRKGRGGARLGTVCVVRNDLTDLDVELVGINENLSQQNPGRKPNPGAGGQVGQKWSRLAVRLFAVGRSRL